MRTFVPPPPLGEDPPPKPDLTQTLGMEPEEKTRERRSRESDEGEVDESAQPDLGAKPSPTQTFEHPMANEGSAEFLMGQMPAAVRENAKKIPMHFLKMDPIELRRMVKPSQTLEGIRTSFWAEYSLATQTGRKMAMHRVWAGICTDIFFYRVLDTPGLFAFVLTPPVNYRVGMDSLLKLSMERMHEILNVPMYDKNGKFLPEVAKIVQKAHEMISYRQMGAPVQKNLTLTGSLTDAHSDIGKLKHEQQARVAELERREKAMAAKFVESTPVVETVEEMDEFTRATLNKG